MPVNPSGSQPFYLKIYQNLFRDILALMLQTFDAEQNMQLIFADELNQRNHKINFEILRTGCVICFANGQYGYSFRGRNML